MKRLERLIDARNTAEGKIISILLSALLVFMMFNASVVISHEGAYAATPETAVEAVAVDGDEATAPVAEVEDEADTDAPADTDVEEPEAADTDTEPAAPVTDEPQAIDPEPQTEAPAAVDTVTLKEEPAIAQPADLQPVTKAKPAAKAKAQADEAQDGWQLPTEEQTFVSYTYCTCEKLPSDANISTATYTQLGTEDGMALNDVIVAAGLTTQQKNGSVYTYIQAEVQNTTNGQKADDNKWKSAFGTGAKATALRFNQGEDTWQYKNSAAQWVDLKAGTEYIVFYYSQNYTLGQNSNIILSTQHWGAPQPGGGVAPDAGGGCVVVQLYDMTGSPIGGYLPIYYWSPYADKEGCSFTIGNHWNVENVALLGVADNKGKLNKGQTVNVNGKVPATFDGFGSVLPEDQINNFTIPFKASWEKIHGAGVKDATYKWGDVNVYIVGVQVSAEPSEQSLTVRYLDSQSGEEIADSQSAVAKKPDGTDAPAWADYVELKDGKAQAKAGYTSGAATDAVAIPVDINNGTATIPLKLADATGYVSANHQAAELDGNTLNLYFDPLAYTVTYTDGVEDAEVFADQSSEVLFGRATPDFQGSVEREGYRFIGWTPAVAPTVTGDAVYTAQWEAVYTVTYDLAGGSVAEGVALQYAGLVEGADTPVIADPVFEGNIFEGWSPAVAPTVTGNAVYTAQWTPDVIGNDPENPGNIDYPDGIADKYQVVVTYTAVNGTIDGAAKVVLNKLDAEGEFAENGTAVLAAEQIPGATASEGFLPEGAWEPVEPVAAMEITENTDFVITFEPVPAPVDPEPTDPEPTDPEPGTDPEPEPAPEPGTDPEPDPSDDPEPETGDPLVPGTPTPGTPGGGTPGTPGGTATPAGTPGPGAPAGPAGPAAAAAAPVTIDDDATPLAAPAEETIADDANPLGAFDEVHCWTHWLMIIGGLLTIAYGAIVLFRRSKRVHDMDDFEGQVLGEQEDAPRGARAPQAGYQAI